jgi:site-specific recombinase XerC
LTQFCNALTREWTDIRYIQKNLGHASIKTTTIYTHVSKWLKIQITDRLVDVNNKKNLVIIKKHQKDVYI